MIPTARLSQLTPHPKLQRVLRVDQCAEHFRANHHYDETRQELAEGLTEDWKAGVESIREVGVLENVKVVWRPQPFTIWTGAPEPEYYIADGRHRCGQAAEAGLEEVPIDVIGEAEAQALIEATVAARRHLSKSARAWFAVVMHPEVTAIEPGRPKVLARTATHNCAGTAQLSQSTLAGRFGVSLRRIQQACEVFRLVEQSGKLRDMVEPSIWAGVSLDAVLRGLHGGKDTQDQDRRPSNFQSVERTLKSFSSQMREFGKWTPVDREKFVIGFKTVAAGLPLAAMEALQDAFKRAEQERRSGHGDKVKGRVTAAG